MLLHLSYSRDLQQLVPLGRLGQIAVDSNFTGARAKLRSIEGRESAQHDLLSPASPANAHRSLESIHVRHGQVQKNHGRVQLLRKLESALARLSHVYFVTARLQKRGESPGGIVTVIDNQHATGTRSARRLTLISHRAASSRFEPMKRRSGCSIFCAAAVCGLSWLRAP